MNKNDQIKAVVFDVDGTLFDTLPALSAAANDVLTQAGMEQVPSELLRPALNAGLMSLFRKALAVQPAGADLDAQAASRLENAYMACYTERWLATTPLFAGAAEALAALQAQGLKLGICTNRDRASTDVLLKSAAIDGMFDVIVGIGDAPQPKPAADPLLLVLERLGMPAAEVLFVGDSVMDSLCAQLCEVRFAAHLDGYASHACDLLPNVMTFSAYDRFAHWVLAPAVRS
jgi:phosphoglycolate phosphatase